MHITRVRGLCRLTWNAYEKANLISWKILVTGTFLFLPLLPHFLIIFQGGRGCNQEPLRGMASVKRRIGVSQSCVFHFRNLVHTWPVTLGSRRHGGIILTLYGFQN